MTTERAYPGEKFGIPESGPGSASTWGRRIGALVLDWIACLGVSLWIVGPEAYDGSGTWSLLPLGIFFIEATVGTTTLGGSLGQVIAGVAVQRTRGGRVNLWRSALRTLLICLVIPAVVFTPDRQGLHDMAADTLPVRR